MVCVAGPATCGAKKDPSSQVGVLEMETERLACFVEERRSTSEESTFPEGGDGK